MMSVVKAGTQQKPENTKFDRSSHQSFQIIDTWHMEKQFHVNKTVHEMLGLFPVELATCSKFL
jgi:hypothetical protein